MTRRSLSILALIAVALLAYVGLSERQTGDSLGAGALLLPALADSLDSIDRIEVRKGGGEVVIAVRRGPSGWVATNKADFPADIGKIRTTLLAVADARILEVKTANPEFYARLGVEPVAEADATGMLLSLTTAEAETIAVIFGNEEGQAYRYARLAEQAQSFLLNKSPELPATAKDWLDAALLNIDSARIREVGVEHADGARVRIFRAQPADTGFVLDDMPADRELLYNGVTTSMAGALSSLSFDDVRAGSPADVVPSAITTYRTYDGLVLVLRSYADGDSTWIAFSASFEPGGVEASESSPADAGGAESDPIPNAEDSAALDPEQEATQLRDKLGDWEYLIPSYKVEQITRRMEDLLKASP